MRIKIYDSDDWIKIVDADNDNNVLYEGDWALSINTLSELLEEVNPKMPQVEIIEVYED